MGSLGNKNEPITRDLVLNWLDKHCNEIGIVKLNVRNLAAEIGKNPNTVNHVLAQLKANKHLIEYTLRLGERVFRRQRPSSALNPIDRRIDELEALTDHNEKLKPLIKQFAALEKSIAEIDSELQETEPASKERDALRKTCAQQITVLLRLGKEIGLSHPQHRATKEAVIETEGERQSMPESWLDNPSVFADKALNMRIYAHQEAFCQTTQRIVVAIAGRGAGEIHGGKSIRLVRRMSKTRPYGSCRLLRATNEQRFRQPNQRSDRGIGNKAYRQISLKQSNRIQQRIGDNLTALKSRNHTGLSPTKGEA